MPRGITLPRAVAAFIGVKPVDAPKWSVVVPVKGGVNGKSRLGEVAVEALSAKLEGEPSSSTMLRPTLVVREST